ncbi:U-box domain-containing protein 5-like isoform X1 [Populus alba x Populus x berolinensis]|nr:U-box domain-containing protein 5-like isoform X1 [Populus alba x Populus x berolinensis]
MCLELKNFVDRISQIYPAIESARPRCSSGVQALCSLVVNMEAAKLLIQQCANSSKLYLVLAFICIMETLRLFFPVTIIQLRCGACSLFNLNCLHIVFLFLSPDGDRCCTNNPTQFFQAITAERILLKCKRIQKALDLCLGQIQNVVPPLLAAKIYGIIEDLRSAKFHLESSEEEAGKVVLALIRRGILASDSIENSELEALRLAASSLKITSRLALLAEKRSIKRLLDKVRQTGLTKETILKCLLSLLRKYGELIQQDQTRNNLSMHREEHSQSTNPEACVDWYETRTQADGTPKPPTEFQCPISTRLMYDPVIIASGKTYERVWIEKWISEGHETCPMTNIRLENLSLTPNVAMKGLISKWCSQHGIIVSDPCQRSKFSPVSSLKFTSPESVASFGSSMDILRLQVSNVSLQSSDTNCGSHLIDDDDDIRSSARLPRMEEEICCTRHSSTNGCGVGLVSLTKLASLPWKSQCKTVQDVKEELNKNNQACDCMFSDTSMKSLIKFLKVAHDLCDVRAQKDSVDVILAILSEDRGRLNLVTQHFKAFISSAKSSAAALGLLVEMPALQGDSIYVLASLLDSKISGKALAILELLSHHQFYKSAVIASGVLPSILKILDSQNTESLELAMKILCNVSYDGDIAYHIVYLDFIPSLVPFLSDRNLSRYCRTVLKNLCRIEEGRIAIVETDSCITSMAQLLETGSELEQETTMEVLSLCYEELDCCQLVKGGSIIQSLSSISVNGTSRGKAIAMELLQLLGHTTEGFSFDLTIDISSGSSNHNKGEKSSSIIGYLRRKIAGFFH